MDGLNFNGIINNLWSKKIQIILIIAIFTVVGVIYTYNFTKPMYQSYTTLVLAKDTPASGDDTSTQGQITQTDISLNNQLVSTYSALMKTKDVLNQVISNLKINIDEETLKNSITVSQVSGTQLIKITVTNAKPELAAKIADETANVFVEKIAKDIYNINNIHIVEKAAAANTPYNINHQKDIILFSFIGVMIAIIYIFFITVFDTTIKSAEDIENVTGLTVLASIPVYGSENKGGKK